jgi:class 3 adenylate cyclase/tetratricopeptide (TPR) repeat protein
MMVTCPNCATPNPPGFRFCGNCAAALDAPPRDRTERRKVVTVLFCDVAGSTRLGEQRDPESMRAVMNLYFDTVRSVLERHGGTVEKFIGDAVMAVFGHPILHEDDALRAVRAADELRVELLTLNERLRREWGMSLETRIGINTGAVVAGDAGSAETLVTGDAVNVAARLQTAAVEGETLIGEETYELVRDAVVVEEKAPLSLKGKELPVQAWRLVSVARDAAGHTRRLDSPLVGRQRELQLLDQAFRQAIGDRGSVLFTLLGSAGIGKSRLVHEFVKSVRENATVLRGRCLPYGEGITFWALAEAVKAASGITDDDSPAEAKARIERVVAADPHAQAISGHVAAAIGLAEESAAGDDIFWAIRRFLELVAVERPLVVVFDDIQWAESTFLDLIDHIADWSRDAPILLLCVARPELLELRPAWAGGKLNATTLLLQSLGQDHIGDLVGNLLGAATLTSSVLGRIVESSEGNPLFVEEFVAMLIDDGLLRRDNGDWAVVGDIESVEVPATIRSLLAARIDRLAPPERRVIERASVVGKVFWRGALAELAPEPARSELGPSLMSLIRKELVRPDRSDFAGDDAFRFRHLLVRDAAYDGLPKQERVQLHVRFAAWLERVAGNRVAEYEELLGYHIEQAYRYRLELGPLDDEGLQLGRSAGLHLLASGERSLERGDAAASAKLLERAARLIPSSDPAHHQAVSALVDAFIDLGRFAEAATRLAEFLQPEDASPRARWRATRQRIRLGILTDPEGMLANGIAEIDAVITKLEDGGDHVAQAEAWHLRGELAYVRGEVADSRRSTERGLLHAQRAGAATLEANLRGELAALGIWDDQPVSDAIEQAEKALEFARATGSRLNEARMLGVLGRLVAMTGDIDRGRELVVEARAIIAELGRRVHHAGSTHWLGVIDRLANDMPALERDLGEGAKALEQLGERSFQSSSLGEMALAMFAQGRTAEAAETAQRVRELAGSEDVEAQQLASTTFALVALDGGRPDEAARLADEVLVSVNASQFVYTRIVLRMLLAPIVSETRRKAVAVELLRDTAVEARHKGIVPFVNQIEAQLADLEADRPAAATKATHIGE